MTGKYISILALLTMPFVAAAEVWSLDSCISYALTHNLTVRSSETNILSGEISVSQAKSGYLPNVSANAGQSWNIGRGLTAENTYANRNTSSFNWGASANLMIFDGLRTPRNVEYAKANLAQILEQYEAAKEDVSVNVISAFLQVLYNKELHDVALNQVALSQHELIRRQSLLEAGKIPEIDMLEAKSILASDNLSEVQALNNLTLAKIDLARLLNLNVDIDNFDVAPLADELALIQRPEATFDKAKEYSHNILASKRALDASDVNIKLSKSGYLPTLSFGTSLGSSYYTVSGFPNESFGRQMKNNYSTSFGFSLNVPLFDAFSTRNAIRRAKADKVAAEVRYDQALDELRHTINQVYYQAVGAQKKFDQSLVAEDFANKAFEAMSEKYNLGKANSTEYEQAKTKALQATAERVQARYELILRVRLLDFYATPH